MRSSPHLPMRCISRRALRRSSNSTSLHRASGASFVAGEPGGGEPRCAGRSSTEAWNAKVTEAMGIGDISVSLWGDARSSRDAFGRARLRSRRIDPSRQWRADRHGPTAPRAISFLTHLRHQGGRPLLRFRSRDHVTVWTSPALCAPHRACAASDGRTNADRARRQRFPFRHARDGERIFARL